MLCCFITYSYLLSIAWIWRWPAVSSAETLHTVAVNVYRVMHPRWNMNRNIQHLAVIILEYILCQCWNWASKQVITYGTTCTDFLLRHQLTKPKSHQHVLHEIFLQLYNHVVFSTNYAAFMNFTETVFHISKFYCLWVFFACLPISVLPVDIRISRYSKLLSAQSCSADCAVECCHVL